MLKHSGRFAEMPRLAQAAWGHRPDAEERGAVQVDPGDHFGGEHPGPVHLDPVPRRVEQVLLHHLERQAADPFEPKSMSMTR